MIFSELTVPGNKTIGLTEMTRPPEITPTVIIEVLMTISIDRALRLLAAISRGAIADLPGVSIVQARALEAVQQDHPEEIICVEAEVIDFFRFEY